MGMIYKNSNRWIRIWKQRRFDSRLDERLMKKYLVSCQPLAIRLGNFERIRPITGLRALGRIIFQTARIMLGFKLD
jgi:hypothetical protein